MINNLITKENGPFDSLFDAVEAAAAENEVVLVCGSLYLIGWIRPRLQGLKNE